MDGTQPLKNNENISLKDQKRREFILHGNMWKVIFVLAFPLMLYAIINYASSIFDMVMANVMDKSGSNAVTSIALVTQIQNMLSSIGSGLAIGGSIIIAREIGKSEFDKARKVSTTVFSLVLLVAIIILLICIPFSEMILRTLGVPKNIISVAQPYFILQLVAACIGMINQIFLSIEKARGATKFITVINLFVIFLKIIFSLIFVYVGKIKDIWCLSLASVIANGCLTLYVIYCLINPKYIFYYRFKNVEFNRHSIWSILKISFPIFLGKFIFSFGKVQINKMAGDYYDKDLPDNPPTTTTSALGISNHLGGSITNVLGTMEDAESSIISQSLGNKDINRALKCFTHGLIINVALAIVGIVLVTIFNDPMVNLFTHTPEAHDLVTQIFMYEKFGVLMLAVNSAVLGLLYGFGYTKLSMVLNLARVFVFRIPVLFLLYNAFHIGREAVGMAMMISNTCIGLTSIIVAIIVININKKKIKNNKEIKDLI